MFNHGKGPIMTTSFVLRHLTSMRDGLKKIEEITRALGDQPDQVDLEAAIVKREFIVADEIDKKAVELTAACPDWRARAKREGALRVIFEEAQGLLRSVFRLDEGHAAHLRRSMGELQSKMGALYQSSRVACSYTTQSRMPRRPKPARQDTLR
jgi:hypothetical protein